MSNLSEWEIVTKEPGKFISPVEKDNIWVRVDAHIREIESGDVRVLHSEGIWDDENDQLFVFNYEEGNYSCDCNRKIFWGRAIEHEYEDEETPCGDGKYSINLVNPQTGEVVYREFSVE